MNLPYQDVCLRPDGMLAFDGIADSDGRYALALLAAKPSSGEPTSFGWLRRLAADHVRRIVAASADGTMPQGASLAACRPDALQTLANLSSVPPMNGCEYWSQESLSAFFERIENAIAGLAADHGGDLLAATATLGPGWRDVGKVSLHLAENKGDKSGTRPFAFLATFVSRSGDDGMAKHLPLSAALKVYAGKPAALSRILAPLETAAHGDKFLLSLLESRRIFQPCALSVGEAYSFLKGIGAYENAGLIVRTGRIWKSAPPKAKVSVSVGKSKTGAIGVNALCDFDVNVTLDGEPLTDEELALLASSGDGLVRIRGEWVEADHAKIDALLSRWKEAKRLMREGLTMAQALRVLAGVFGREGLVLHGGTPVSKRGSLVKAFQDAGGPPFFVLSVKAAGTGLNLTAANHVVHFDRWWNPAVENQASDRAFRIGQKKNVLIHKFVTPGTLEEKIDAMIKEKQALADSLFADAGEKLVTEMSDDELLELVKLDATGV